MKKFSEICVKQMNLFYLALSFFTRLPVPKSMEYSPELLSQSSRYFSLVGLLLGAMLALAYSVISPFFSPAITILMIMSLSLLLTGAFHEDGLADMADGFGGGYHAEQCLIIMKDSRIGTYGAVTLIMALALKFSLLVELATYNLSVILMSIVLSQSLSRAIAASLIATMPYVSDERSSKSKPLATEQSTTGSFILLFIGCLPLWFYPIAVVVTCLMVLLIFRWLFQQWLMKKIGGFTGDCLGAAQQTSEILILMVMVFYVKTELNAGIL